MDGHFSDRHEGCYYTNTYLKAQFPQSQTSRSLVLLDEADEEVRSGGGGVHNSGSGRRRVQRDTGQRQQQERYSHFDPLFTVNGSSYDCPQMAPQLRQRNSLSLMTSSSSAATNNSNSSNSSRSTGTDGTGTQLPVSAHQQPVYNSDNTYSSSLLSSHHPASLINNDSMYQHGSAFRVSLEQHMGDSERGLMPSMTSAVWEVNPDANYYQPRQAAAVTVTGGSYYLAGGQSHQSGQPESEGRRELHDGGSDDYFLSINKDLKTVQPIHVSEL